MYVCYMTEKGNLPHVPFVYHTQLLNPLNHDSLTHTLLELKENICGRPLSVDICKSLALIGYNTMPLEK